jgi:hypothetical protein
VGPRVGLDVCKNSRPPPGFDPRTAQPLTSRYTDYAIPAHGSQVAFKNTALKLSVNGKKRTIFLTLTDGTPARNTGIRLQLKCDGTR